MSVKLQSLQKEQDQAEFTKQENDNLKRKVS